MHVNAPQGRSHHHTQIRTNLEETDIIHKYNCTVTQIQMYKQEQKKKNKE